MTTEFEKPRDVCAAIHIPFPIVRSDEDRDAKGIDVFLEHVVVLDWMGKSEGLSKMEE